MFKLRDFKDNGFKVYKTKHTNVLDSEWSCWLCKKRIKKYIPWVEDMDFYINVYVSDTRLWGLNSYTGNHHRSFTVKLSWKQYVDDIAIAGPTAFRDGVHLSLQFPCDAFKDVDEIEKHCIMLYRYTQGAY